MASFIIYATKKSRTQLQIFIFSVLSEMKLSPLETKGKTDFFLLRNVLLSTVWLNSIFTRLPYEVQESDLWDHIKASFIFEILVKHYMIWHNYIEK